jgi:hypothetical protein
MKYKNKYPVFPTHRSLSLTMSPLLANGLRYAVENGMNCGTACAGLISILIVYMVLSRSGREDIIRTIRGPPSPSWIFVRILVVLSISLVNHDSGHMLQLLLSPTCGDYEFDWLKLYGSVYLLNGCFGVSSPPLPWSTCADSFAAKPPDGLRPHVIEVHLEQSTFRFWAEHGKDSALGARPESHYGSQWYWVPSNILFCVLTTMCS